MDVYIYIYDACICTSAYMYVSHRGGFLIIFYSVHALGIIHQQQSWFGAIR